MRRAIFGFALVVVFFSSWAAAASEGAHARGDPRAEVRHEGQWIDVAPAPIPPGLPLLNVGRPDATGLTASSTNAGSAGVNARGAAFNEFEGLGGDDTITGNGNTRISYLNALAGVTVTMTSVGAGTAHGTDPGRR